MDNKTYKKHLTVWIIITIVLVGISFYAGDKHGQGSSRNAMMAARGQFGAGAAGARGGAAGASRFGTGGGAVTGSVTSEDATSITVASKDGSSKIIFFSGTTPILKTSAGSASDIAVGTQVSVVGTQNSDGSVTAQSIQIRPAMPAGTATGGTTAAAPATTGQ